jgi:hypothetical protein
LRLRGAGPESQKTEATWPLGLVEFDDVFAIEDAFAKLFDNFRMKASEKGGRTTMVGATFKINPYRLQELLQNCDRGILQLPDFQRSWVWDEDRIKSLIASVSLLVGSAA